MFRETSGDNNRVIALDAQQIISIHGWFNPIRFLSWDHVVAYKDLSFGKLLELGVSTSDLYFLQQDVQQWITRKGVSFQDVPDMIRWPLHPLYDLKGDLSHFLENKYSAEVLHKLGITFRVLTDQLGMREEHMELMRLSIQDWKLLGMKKKDVEAISKLGCRKIFGWDSLELIHGWGC